MEKQRVIFIGTGSRTNERILVDLNPDGTLPRLVTFPDTTEGHVEPGIETSSVTQVEIGSPDSTTYALILDHFSPEVIPLYLKVVMPPIWAPE